MEIGDDEVGDGDDGVEIVEQVVLDSSVVFVVMFHEFDALR